MFLFKESPTNTTLLPLNICNIFNPSNLYVYIHAQKVNFTTQNIKKKSTLQGRNYRTLEFDIHVASNDI
jgi:hypothetical protein